LRAILPIQVAEVVRNYRIVVWPDGRPSSDLVVPAGLDAGVDGGEGGREGIRHAGRTVGVRLLGAPDGHDPDRPAGVDGEDLGRVLVIQRLRPGEQVVTPVVGVAVGFGQ
jgi:hypothetical protein